MRKRLSFLRGPRCEEWLCSTTLRVLFIAPQSFTSSRDASDVNTLAKVLRRADHTVDLVAPLYGHIDAAKLALARRLTKLEFELGGRPWSCEIYSGRSPDGVGLTFIGNEEVLLAADSLDAGSGDQLEATRVGVFGSGVLELVRGQRADYDLVHGHGWVGAAALARLRSAMANLPTVLTVYDAARQGRFDARDAGWIGLEAGPDETGVNALRSGLLAADRVVTLSPNYAHRLQRPGEGEGLSTTFADIRRKLIGIRHGIDPALWNPATDRHLSSRFDPFDLDGKEKCKAELQRELALPVRSDVPLVGAAGHVEDEGMHMIAKLGPDLLRNDVQLVVQLDGDGELVAIYEELWDQWPDRIQIKTGNEEAFRHQLLGAADWFIAPDRATPGDDLQMLAQRYGAIPIVRRDGTLADEVVDCDASLQTGSGLMFDETTAASMLAALQRAAAVFANSKAFAELQRRVMRIDHSWERTTRLYERVYRDAVAAHD